MTPYTVTVELTRSKPNLDPAAVRVVDEEYLLRQEGEYRSSRLPWDPALMANLAELARPAPDREMAQRLGDTLRTFLGPLGWEVHEERLRQALREGREVRITFRFAAEELYVLPWELVTLKGSRQHLSELPGCHLHYEWPGPPDFPVQAGVAPEGGRILLAWSAAGGGVPWEGHQYALREVCERHGHAFDPTRDVLEGVSLRSLSAALAASPEPVAALHILCHGAFLPPNRYGLMWNASEGTKPTFVDAGDLRHTLGPHANKVRMVVLSACQSGNAALGSHLGSVAQALHRVGIPAVVASRMPLSTEGSVRMTQVLYEELLGLLSPLGRALAVVRGRLQEDAEHLDWASLQLYLREGEELAERPFILRPYRGLLAFGPKDRRFFFGRRRLEAALLERVNQAVQGQKPRFQVVAGASGAGKSSVVMAGLVPLLPAKDWDWLVVRPGELVRAGPRASGERSVTLRELLHRLHRLGSSEPLPARGDASREELVEEMRRLRQARPARKLLLVVDQLEEIFTQLEGEERLALMRGLWALTQAPELGCVVVSTIRVDHFERCGEVVLDERTRLDTVMYAEEHRVFVAQMGREELEEAIEQPANKVGLELEPGLADRLCDEVGQEPGALPLLAHALDLLWQRREGRWLKHQTYEDLEGVGGALTQTAESLYEALSEAERAQARRLLVRLVAARDMGSPRARGRVWEEEVRPQEGSGREAFRAALEKLVGRRLVVTGGGAEGEPGGRGGWVQLAHETLLRRWKRLGQWVAEDWEREQQLRELEGWAEDWEEHRGNADQGGSYLLTGDRLSYAKGLRGRLEGELSPRSRRLIEESLAAEARRQEKEQEAARVLMEARARASRFFKGGFAVAVVLLVLMGVVMAQESAQRKKAQNTARMLWSEMFHDEDPTKALFLLREVSNEEKNHRWWVESLIKSLHRPVAQAVLGGHEDRVWMATFSPDGTRVVTASQDGTARVWSTDGALLARLEGHGRRVATAHFSPDGQRVVTASADGTARVWNSDGVLLAKLEGHEDPVWMATFSPDGTRVVTASVDGTARVWSVQGALLARLEGHGDILGAASFSPDGTRVVTASKDGTARVWSTDGVLLAKLEGHDDAVISASFSPDGTRVVTASDDGTARVWSTGGALRAKLEGHGHQVLRATFSPDGQRVVTASADWTARVWSTDGALLATLEGHSNSVNFAHFSPDGTRVVTASDDGTARVWSTDGALLAKLEGHGGALNVAAFSPDGKRVVTASDDRTARVWNSQGAWLSRLEGQKSGPLSSARFSPDGQRVVTASDDRTARVWSTDGVLLAKLEGHGDEVWVASFSPDGQRIMTASRDGTARVWSTDGALLARLEGHEGPLKFASLSPDGTRVVTASEDKTARVWSIDGALRVKLEGHGGSVNSARFSPDGTRVVTASADGTARVWNSDGVLLAKLEGHGDQVWMATFSPDGTRVVTASVDGTARVWSTDGALLAKLEGHGSYLTSVSFNPDGQRVVTASSDWTARVWSTEGELLAKLEGHGGAVYSVDFSPDGKRVVTASGDGTARLWSTKGTLLTKLEGHGAAVSSATFSPDGERVVTSSMDGTTRIWPVSARLLMQHLEAVARGCLTLEERQTYLDETYVVAKAALERCQRTYGQQP